MHTAEPLPDMAGLVRAHRQALLRLLPDAPIVVGSAPELLRNGDVHFAYRQSSDFIWLTGVEQPGCTLLLDAATRTQTLFVPRLTQQHAVWLGHIPDKAEARRSEERDYRKGRSPKARRKRASTKRSRATSAALKKQPRRAASHKALSRQASTSARKRGPMARRAAAKKAARTRARAR